MKTCVQTILILLAIFLSFNAAATPTPLVSITVSNTTVTVPNMPAQSSNPVLQNGTITHGALTSTNELQVNIYNTFQSSGTNGRVFLGTWYPSTTNPATETINGYYLPTPTNFVSFDIVTTNAVTISGTYGQ